MSSYAFYIVAIFVAKIQLAIEYTGHLVSRLLEHLSSLSLRLMRTNARSYKILRSFTYPGEKGLWWAHANQCKMKELGFWQMTRWKFHLFLLFVSWFLEIVLNCK